jgi:hypothetical protein
MKNPLAIVLAFALVAPAAAQTGNDPQVITSKNFIQTYVFATAQNGKTGLRGRVKRVAGKEVTFTVYQGPATWDEKHDLDMFTPPSQFRIMQVVTPDTAEAQLDLARWGLDHDAPTQANYALMTARSLAQDPNLGAGLHKSIREQTAARLRNRFQYELAQGRVATANQALRELNRYYADVVPANVLAQMNTSLQAREAQFRQDQQAKRAAEAVARKDKDFHRKLKPIQARVARGQADINRGLNAGSSMSKALNSFGNAIRDLDNALRACDRLHKEYGNEGTFTADLNYLHEQAQKSLTEALLNSASIYTARGSFNNALGNVNKILAYDPNNTRALAMRGRIESAANEGWGWGGGWGRGAGPVRR